MIASLVLCRCVVRVISNAVVFSCIFILVSHDVSMTHSSRVGVLFLALAVPSGPELPSPDHSSGVILYICQQLEQVVCSSVRMRRTLCLEDLWCVCVSWSLRVLERGRNRDEQVSWC